MSGMVLVLLAYCVSHRWDYNALLSGEETAVSLGIHVQRLTLTNMVLCCLTCSIIVSRVGLINFIGLVAPHIVRMVVGNNHVYLIPGSVLAGAVLLLLILVGGMIGAISYRMIRTMKMPVEYESVSKLYITFNQDENGDVYQYYNGYTWNELLDTDPILIAIMNHLTGYEEEEVKDAASAEILSDIRLLTITVKGDSEKMVREIQAAVEEGLADYADQSEELRKIVTIRSDMPKRIYWSDDTTKALIAGAVLFGLVSFFVFGFMYVLDDGVYVQADVERRYPYKALGIMTRNQKGLQPFVRELKADLLYVMGDSRDMLLLDMDNHGELRQADMDKLLNWEEGGTLGGDKDIGGELVWHVRKEDEDEEDEDILPEPKEWKITVFNESDMGEEQCAAIRKNGGVILLIPFGNDVSRKTERMLSFLKNQDCNVYGIIVTEADEEYLNRYFA